VWSSTVGTRRPYKDLRERARRLAEEIGVVVEITDPRSVEDRQGVRRVIIRVVPAAG
jgi:hypothetical protein